MVEVLFYSLLIFSCSSNSVYVIIWIIRRVVLDNPVNFRKISSCLLAVMNSAQDIFLLEFFGITFKLEISILGKWILHKDIRFKPLCLVLNCNITNINFSLSFAQQNGIRWSPMLIFSSIFSVQQVLLEIELNYFFTTSLTGSSFFQLSVTGHVFG